MGNVMLLYSVFTLTISLLHKTVPLSQGCKVTLVYTHRSGVYRGIFSVQLDINVCRISLCIYPMYTHTQVRCLQSFIM